MLLKVDTHETQPGVLCIAVAGEIDMDTVGRLSEVITTAILNPRFSTVHVDIGAVTFLGSQGINALIRGYNLAGEQKTSYRVVNARGSARRVLEITNILGVLGGQPADDPSI